MFREVLISKDSIPLSKRGEKGIESDTLILAPEGAY
jgi:hypothetical protein